MSNTTYPGIDYAGPAATCNRDTETGIRYGIIAQNSVNSDALEDVFQGRDLGFEQAEQELKDKLRHALEDYFSDSKWGNDTTSRLDKAVENAMDSLDGWADGLESSGPYALERDDYSLQTTERGELWVFKAPYFTYAQFCSPCVPGAGNLDSPCESGPKTYCLGGEWFSDDAPMPYPVYSVATGKLVQPA